MGKFVYDVALKGKNKYTFYFKNLNFNFSLSSKIRFIKKIHVLQNLFLFKDILVENLYNNIFPILAIYTNLTISSSWYYFLKIYLKGNFFKLYTKVTLGAKFNFFF